MEERYIYYLSQEGDTLESCSKPLVFPRADCMEHLASMVDNASDTVIDMQDYIRRKNLDEILYPAYDYCVKLSGVTMESENATTEYIPKDEYEYMNMIHNWEENINKMKNSAYIKYKQRDMEETIRRDKKRFFSIMEIKSQAYTFINTYEHLENQISPKVIAISTRKIGWETEKLINFKGDLNCKFKTNFGYGSARYLYLIMYYKSVPIFLYSEWVKYFYANKTDIIRYTQSYLTQDSSWGCCFDLILDIHNSLKDGNDSFVERWMNEEVRLLVEGLEDIANNKKSVFLVKNTNQEYVIDDKREFTRLKAEKLSGALDFIESIENLDKFDIKTQNYTDKIIEMNKAAYPEFIIEKDLLEKACKKTNDELREAISLKEKKEKAVKFKFRSHLTKIKSLYFRKYKERMDELEAMSELKSINLDYKRAIEEIGSIEKKIELIESCKNKLTRFYDQMSGYIKVINKHIPSLKKN